MSSSGNEPASRAGEVLRAVMLLAAEAALDLEVSADEAREIFNLVLFERAELRHGSSRSTAAALSTTLRTVQNYRRRQTERPGPTLFNMRRRVLHVLDEGPADRASIESRLPAGSDVNFTRSALKSLIEDGLVVLDRRLDKYRRKNPHYRPWYHEADVFPGEALRLFFEQFARHFGSRFTPKIEDGTAPASMCALRGNVPAARLREFVNELYALLAEFERRWAVVDRDTPGDVPRVLAGCEAAFGRIGPAASDEELQRASSVTRGPIWDTTRWGPSN